MFNAIYQLVGDGQQDYCNNQTRMTWDPRITGYQIPYQPLFETTKQEIERSLLALEEKLRRRKQIDQEINPRGNGFPLAAPLADNYYQTLRELEDQERAHRILVEEEMKLQMTSDLAHRERMEQLRIERDHLARQAVFSAARYEPLPLPISYPSDDDELLKKYEDGSKAKEYYKDLEHQLKKQEEAEVLDARAQVQREFRERERLREMIGKQQQYQTDRQLNLEKEEEPTVQKSQKKKVEFTPYDYIKQSSSQKQQTDIKKGERSHLAKQLEKEFDQLEKKHAKSTQKLPSYQQSTYRTSSPVKILKERTPQASPYQQRMTRYSSMGRMPCNRSRSNLSPHRTSVLEGSYLQAKNQKSECRPSTKQIELNAIKKIQNRLKVSKVIYEDSQFRNSKYEGNHLFNTFQIEARNRREIKDRINGHPFVLKKHAMVID